MALNFSTGQGRRRRRGHCHWRSCSPACLAGSGGRCERGRRSAQGCRAKRRRTGHARFVADHVCLLRRAAKRAAAGLRPRPLPAPHAAVKYLTDHYHKAPVWVVACLEDAENPDRTAGSSIYPAVQNMLLATRALGLGTTLTTAHRLRERSRRDFRLTVGRPFLCDPADRLADGSVRPVGPRAAQGCRLSRSVGQTLSGL